MLRNYERLSIEELGRQLIATNDLDPVYNALVGCRKGQAYDDPQLHRWLIGYWCFYSTGVASWMSERTGFEFWDSMAVAAENKAEAPVGGRWPRGHERRHFRGQNAIESVYQLRLRYGKRPEDMVEGIIKSSTEEPIPMKVISERVQEHRGFGPWIGWKIADMVDRVLGISVDFSDSDVFMFKDPEKAAWMLWEATEGKRYPPNTKFKREKVLGSVTQYLTQAFSDFRAPPFFDRPVNIQEVETVLCKWKSHMNGHYSLFTDIREIKEGLSPWVTLSSAARKFNSYLPEGGLG